jgi:hypothetical protein
MRKSPIKMDVATMKLKTNLSKQSVDGVIKRAKLLTEDPDKKERLNQSECISCFYMTGMAGQAFTTRPCMCCGKDMMFGSTSTDVLCIDCAKEHKLCKHCGGDIGMKVNSRNWPKPKIDNISNI